MLSRSWKLKALGGFELRNPDGEVIRLPTRKVERLMVMLALTPGRNLDREQIQRELWPGSGPPKQQASLRQALSHLRKSLGEDSIEATRDRCGLAPGFALQSDVEEVESALLSPGEPRPERELPDLLPDAGEPWFERKRRHLRVSLGSNSAREDGGTQMPVHAILQLLRWYADTDSGKRLEAMRDHRELIHGIAPRELQPIADKVLARANPSHPLLGWAYLWKGICVLTSREVAGGEALLDHALRLGSANGDVPLQLEAGVFLAAGQIVSGRTLAAERSVRLLRNAAEESGSKALLARARSITGALLVHQGQVDLGLRMMERAQEGFEEFALAEMNMEMLRGLFLATSGHLQKAAAVLEEPERRAYEAGLENLISVSLLTRSIIAIRSNERALAINLLQELVERSSAAKSGHMEIYAREALALATWREAEKSAAVENLKVSGKLRRNLGMGITEWDRSRLEELLRLE